MNGLLKDLKSPLLSVVAMLLLIACLVTGVEKRGYAAEMQQGTSQTPSPHATAQSSAGAPQQNEGALHGNVKSGATPLPGVRITATNTLTGTKYSAATDADGNYSMTIPQNGHYVVRVEFTVFAAVAKEALINAQLPDQQVDFSLVLASRAEQQENAEQNAQSATARQYSGVGAHSLSLAGFAMDLITAAASGGSAGTQLPAIAGNGDFSSDSVAVSGQNGVTNQFAGFDVDQLRQQMQRGEVDPSLTGTPAAPGGQQGGLAAFRGNAGGAGNGVNAGRAAAIFRNLKPNQPHGALFWTGGNGALNAANFAIRGQEIVEPSYGQNQFGLTYIGAPYIPKLITNDMKDFLFLGLSTQRSSQPFDEYGTVPTAEERIGNLTSLTTQSGNPITIYNPSVPSAACTADGNKSGQPFVGNVIPSACVSPQTTALLNYVPLPNLPGQFLNYQRLAAAQTNTTKFGFRYNRSIGSGTGSPLAGMLQRYLGRSAPGQSINVNYNFMHSGSDLLDLFPNFDGKSEINQSSLQLGYSLGIGNVTNNLSVNWNRTNTQISNEFTNGINVATAIGLNGLPSNPLLYGLPNITMNQFSSLSEQQPNYQINQSIALSESSVWIHQKHNVKFGADVHRVHLDMIGETNSTGNYIFTGVFTAEPGTSSSGIGESGSSLADLLLGFPQQTAIQAPYEKAYLRENTYDAYAQDDWRALPGLTILYGLRYEYFSPYAGELIFRNH